MIYTDPLYGSYPIDDPAILALLESPAVQRLKGVLQHGVTALIEITRPTTRFEHSLGVMVLVGRLGGKRREQIAALLHDVSHTAFSHVIDYVFENHHGQNYHDEHKERYMAGTDLPKLLAQFDLDWRDFLEESHFPLLEQPAPRLCADRLDYFLRDCLDLELATAEQVTGALDRLVVYQGRIAVENLEAARWLADTYMAADEASWANFREVGLYELTARAIRYALSTGILGEEDIWGMDRVVWSKLQASADPQLLALLAPIKASTQFVWDAERPDFRVSTKLRTIDPDIVSGGELRSLSELDPEFGRAGKRTWPKKRGYGPCECFPTRRRNCLTMNLFR